MFYLVDANTKVLGYQAGHAAMIMGSDSEGWYYFSFGVGAAEEQGISRFITENGNMEVDYFSTLREAQTELNRYDHYMRWDVSSASSIRSAFREATNHLTNNYFLIAKNCDDIASDIIRSAGVQLDDNWIPNLTYFEQEDSADEANSWKAFIDLSN